MKHRAFAPFIIGSMVLASSSVYAAELMPKDYVEIGQLYAAYNIAVDGGDAEGFANTFTPDGAFNSFSGHDALVAFIGTWRGKMNGADRRHWNTSLRFEGTPEGARGSAYVMLLDVSTQPVSIASVGVYNDTLVKTKDGWRFKQRNYRKDAPAVAAAPNSAPASPPIKP